MRTFALLLALSACSPKKPPCTEESLNALRALYTHAAKDVISSGACDKYEKVESCPAYRTVELHFEIAGKAICE